MKISLRSIRQWFLLALAIVGAGVAIYLTTVHYAQVPLLCSSQGLVNCERVTSSSYSVIPGTTLPITLPGLAWFIVSGVLAFIGTRSNRHWIRQAQLAWTILGTLTVLYLVYVELVILHTICIWCTVVHVLIFGALLVAITEYMLSRQQEEQEAGEEESALVVPPH
jgi:uncharacterized membrane protein